MKTMLSLLSKKVMFAVLLTLICSIEIAAAGSEDCPVEKAVSGKKSTSEVIVELKSLMKSENCADLSKNCQLRGEGQVSGAWKKHRIFLDDAPVAGANDLDGLMENVNELRSSGVCAE